MFSSFVSFVFQAGILGPLCLFWLLDGGLIWGRICFCIYRAAPYMLLLISLSDEWAGVIFLRPMLTFSTSCLNFLFICMVSSFVRSANGWLVTSSIVLASCCSISVWSESGCS